jgi:1-acyl-sn-glycerol-3-phosphate acyltransferase
VSAGAEQAEARAAATGQAPRRLARRVRPFPAAAGSSADPWVFTGSGRPGLWRRLRMLRRLVLVLLWTLLCMPVQLVLLGLPGRAKAALPRWYWSGVRRLIGIRVRCIGSLARPRPGRPVVYVCNHSSWIDIAVLGGILEGRFIAKAEVGTWPLINAVAWLGRTVFVSRQRATTAQERDAMQAVLAAGDGLVLFPEGTTSDGSRVLPFRTPFFAVATTQPPPMIQPVSIVYDRLGGLPLGRGNRPVFAWYGDMDIASHFARLGQLSGMRVSVVLHEPFDAALFPDRKALSQAVWQTVAAGADQLRQNRPVRPLAVAVPATAA